MKHLREKLSRIFCSLLARPRKSSPQHFVSGNTCIEKPAIRGSFFVCDISIYQNTQDFETSDCMTPLPSPWRLPRTLTVSLGVHTAHHIHHSSLANSLSANEGVWSFLRLVGLCPQEMATVMLGHFTDRLVLNSVSILSSPYIIMCTV